MDEVKKNKDTTRSGTYEALREMIISGRYRPGQRLNERIITEELNVSRTPIREALGKLEQENLVTIIPYHGAVVNELTLEDAKKIYDVHCVLEGLVLKLACENMTEEILSLLEDNTKNYERAMEVFDLDSIIKYNREFHETIYECSANHHLINMLDEIRARMSLLRVNTLSLPERAQKNLDEHKIMLNAFKTRDGQLLEVLGKLHITNASKITLDIISKNKEKLEKSQSELLNGI